MDHRHRTIPQIEAVTVGEPPGTGDVAHRELGRQGPVEHRRLLGREPVPGEQDLPGTHRGEIVDVGMDLEVVAGQPDDVILVGVADDDGVGLRRARTQRQRGVDEQRSGVPSDQQRVALGVGPAVASTEDSHGSVLDRRVLVRLHETSHPRPALRP